MARGRAYERFVAEMEALGASLRHPRRLASDDAGRAPGCGAVSVAIVGKRPAVHEPADELPMRS